MAKSLEAALQQTEQIQIGEDILQLSADEIYQRTKLIENEIKIMQSENTRLGHEQHQLKEKMKDNLEKIKMNRQLPYLVGNIVEVKTKRKKKRI